MSEAYAVRRAKGSDLEFAHSCWRSIVPSGGLESGMAGIGEPQLRVLNPIIMRAWILIALLPPALALGEEPSLDQIVARARAVADQKLGPVTCRMSIETRIFDKSGKLEHTETRDGEVKLDGDDSDFRTTRVVRDGKPLDAKALADERAKEEKARAEKKKKGDDDFDLSPL